MTIHTDYEDHSLKHLLEAFQYQQRLIDENGRVITQLILNGTSGEDEQVKNIAKMIEEEKQIQLNIAYEFTRRFLI